MVIIARTKDHYVVTFKKTEGNQANSTISQKDFDSTFSKALIDFSKYYQYVLGNYKYREKNDSFSIGTINSLTIQRGFHPIYLPDVSYKDLNGLYDLNKNYKSV